MTYLRRAAELHANPRRARNLWWTESVSYRVGSLVAAVLEATRVSPNQVTVFGLLLHLAGAAFVAATSAPATPAVVAVVIVLWQLAYGFDCADGQLARARGIESAFGAWLDQVVDLMAHVFVFGAMSLYLSQALSLETIPSVALTTFLVGTHALHGAAAGLKGVLIGRRGSVTGGSRSRLLGIGHLSDYGFLLFGAAILMPWPSLLAIFVVALSILALASVGLQVLVEWRQSSLAGKP